MSRMMDSMRETYENVRDRFGNASHDEGGLARPIEEMTARLPSDTFLWLACGSIVGSLVLKMSNAKDEHALFVGQWAPTFLLLGLYNKIVKVAGHD